MHEKPRLGVVFFAARWFEEVVLGSDDTVSQYDKFRYNFFRFNFKGKEIWL